MTNVEWALQLVKPGQTIGLGSGHAAERFLRALAERVRNGLHIRGVPTSRATETLARNLGIPLVSLEEGMPLDLVVDGADEVDPELNLIKGYGHALVREKIVAWASPEVVILIGPEQVAEKRVRQLGQRGKLPVEVVPFAWALCRWQFGEFGLPAEPVYDGNKDLLVTDNGNHILECRIPLQSDPAELDRLLCAIPGVVETGFFIGIATTVLIQDGDRLEIQKRKHT